MSRVTSGSHRNSGRVARDFLVGLEDDIARPLHRARILGVGPPDQPSARRVCAQSLACPPSRRPSVGGALMRRTITIVLLLATLVSRGASRPAAAAQDEVRAWWGDAFGEGGLQQRPSG